MLPSGSKCHGLNDRCEPLGCCVLFGSVSSRQLPLHTSVSAKFTRKDRHGRLIPPPPTIRTLKTLEGIPSAPAFVEKCSCNGVFRFDGIAFQLDRSTDRYPPKKASAFSYLSPSTSLTAVSSIISSVSRVFAFFRISVSLHGHSRNGLNQLD